MIRIHPVPEVAHRCPSCGLDLDVIDWYMPGMRTLADLRCGGCGRRYYGDLPAGHGLMAPALVDRQSGELHHSGILIVFAEHLQSSYAARVDHSDVLQVEELRPLRRPLLLNCLDWVYGHALLKLLNAQYYLDHASEFDLVVVVPRFLRWMVPDGVAQIWTVDLPLSRGAEWNDWLAREAHRRLDGFPELFLSVALSHPHPQDVQIQRFTGVAPMRLDGWGQAGSRPTVTFIWRGDRAWRVPERTGVVPQVARRVMHRLRRGSDRSAGERQVIAFADALRRSLPDLDFAVAGIGAAGRLPRWIADLRTERVDARVEREWCERYARSQVVIGVHGSNLLLPSAHAGGVVEVVPDLPWDSRWGNIIQDLLPTCDDVREALFRYRFLPTGSSPEDVASVVTSMIRFLPLVRLNFRREWTGHTASWDHWRTLRRAYQEADGYSAQVIRFPGDTR